MKEVINKLLSGRYALTILAGLAFIYATWKRILPAEAVATIITMVFMAYFQRNDRPTNGGVK